ncbi:F-box/kelch-repeat protein At3g23880-like [Quercus lobata]|uniref:F-box/kelch-repeat protein At3g23880-like n=1 Tax=Quercus lobata TaxID=97700 RepID=UPI001246C454|nr:F-box/kelch-repeat protein At3g23880-like [Quercus lobata]
MSQAIRERVPNDVVADILGGLPVKSLIRFSCVSKFLNSIISDPTFISTHFKLNLNQPKSSISPNTQPGYYLLYKTSSSKELCTVFCNNDDYTLTQISRFEIPNVFDKCSEVVGFCNGIFCLASFDKDLHHISYLWNPSIGMFKKLLATRLTGEDFRIVVFGLAYDCQNNDFKVLRLVGFFGREAEAEIYSLRMGSWTKVVISMESLRGYEPNIGTIVDVMPPCVFCNGALHCTAFTRQGRFILSFDVSDERFREIMMPRDFRDGIIVMFEQVAVFKGSLAIIVFSHNFLNLGIPGGCLCHIWVMEEYGVADSWTRKFLVPLSDWVWEPLFYGCTDNGELLIKNDSGLVSIDPESRNQNILAIEDSNWVGFSANSMESLVLLDGGK